MAKKDNQLEELQQVKDPLFNLGLFSIANQLRYGLPLLVILSLLITAGGLIYLAFQTQVQQLAAAQTEQSRAAAGEINTYLDDLQRKLSYLARVRGLTELSPEIQRNLLEGLTRHNDAYEAVAILNHTGRAKAIISPYGPTILNNDLANSPLFLRAFKQQEDYIGPVEINPATNLPAVSLAVPIRNEQDKVAGVLVARVNLKFLWFVVSQTQVGETGYVYVIDNRNFLIAEKGINIETFELQDISDKPFIQNLTSGKVNPLTPYQGLEDQQVLGAIAPVRSVRWNVVVELPTREAYRPITEMFWLMGIALAGATLITVGVGIYFSRGIILPLQHLTKASAQISAGNMETQVNVTNRNEMGVLAATFNKMTSQLKDLYTTLEQRVASRTQRLETVASLSEQLSSILKLEDLLAEVVNQIKDKFDYYHAHIYLLDEEQNLVVAEGVGAAGAEMKAKKHSIPLQAQTSLVARAARTGEIVSVDNVRQAEDWLPNPLLPNTYSEMAVPIIVDGQVVGVLDVQEDTIAGLDEGDANLLRSLVNQVAVAIRNARLFAEVETALAKAYAAQERYVEQSWDKAKIVRRHGQYHYKHPQASELSEAQKQALAEAKSQVLDQSRPATVTLNGDQAAAMAVISPVVLHQKAIGALQLYPAKENHTWTEDDLAIIEAVSEELAQAAESLRLFEETRERASREQLVSQISNKMRRAPDIESLLQITVSELARVLNPARTFVQLNLNEGQALDKPNLPETGSQVESSAATAEIPKI